MKKLLQLLILMIPFFAMGQSPVIVTQPYKFQKYVHVAGSLFSDSTLLSTDSSKRTATTDWVKRNFPQSIQPNSVISGLTLSVTDSLLTVSSGMWIISNVVHSKGTATNFILSARDSINSRYETVYATGSNTIGIAVGLLSPTPVEPPIPTGTIRVGSALITPIGTALNQPGINANYVYSAPPVKQFAFPYVYSMKADTFKTAHYIFPSVDGSSGQVVQTNGAGALFWSNQAIYNNGYGLNLGANIFKVDTTKVSTIIGLVDTVKAHGAVIGYGLAVSADTLKVDTSVIHGGGHTINSLTVNSSGSGALSPFTFNGSVAKTLSYNSIGAQPTLVSGTNLKTINSTTLLGSSNILLEVPLIFNSGLTRTTNTVALGGTLLATTYIQNNAHILKLDSLNILNQPVFLTQVPRLADLELINTILTGLVTTASGTNAATTAGTYRVNNLVYTLGSTTNTTIPVQDATLSRYSIIYGTTSRTLGIVNGTLSLDPSEPNIPANTVQIATILITPSSVTPSGGGSKKTGTVTLVTSSTPDILVSNSTTTPTLTLNKVNGVPLNYFDPTSSIQTQLNTKQATLVSGTNIKTVNGNSLLGSGNVSISGGVVHANNGLSLSGDTVQLGGNPLNAFTDIDLNGQELDIVDHGGGNNTGLVLAGGSSSMFSLHGSTSTLASIEVEPFDFTPGSNVQAKSGVFYPGSGGPQKFVGILEKEGVPGITAFDDKDLIGIQNNADYSTNIKLHNFALTPWGMVKAGLDSLHTVIGGTLYTANGTITAPVRQVQIGANELDIVAHSGIDSTFVTHVNDYYHVVSQDTLRTGDLVVQKYGTGISASILDGSFSGMSVGNLGHLRAAMQVQPASNPGMSIVMQNNIVGIRVANLIDSTGMKYSSGGSVKYTGNDTLQIPHIGWIKRYVSAHSGSDSTIYKTDGVIAGNRVVDWGNHHIGFNSTDASGSGSFQIDWHDPGTSEKATFNLAEADIDMSVTDPSSSNAIAGIGIFGFSRTVRLFSQNSSFAQQEIKLQSANINDPIKVTDDGNAGMISAADYSTKIIANDLGYTTTNAVKKIAGLHTIFTPTTGATVSLANNQYNIINPAGALATLTVNLPSSPANNDKVTIKYTQSVTTVTYGNGTVVDGITSPVGGGMVVLVYDSGTTSWY